MNVNEVNIKQKLLFGSFSTMIKNIFLRNNKSSKEFIKHELLFKCEIWSIVSSYNRTHAFVNIRFNWYSIADEWDAFYLQDI